MVHYNVGDYVSIKCRVVSHQGESERITLERQLLDGQWIRIDSTLDQIDRPLPKPLPDEPPHDSLLKDRHGTIWTFKTGWRKPGGYRFDWGQDFYEMFGPFDVFTPEMRV